MEEFQWNLPQTFIVGVKIAEKVFEISVKGKGGMFTNVWMLYR